MEQEQNPQGATEQVPADAGSLDAAALAFEQRETALAQPEEEVKTEGEEADPDAEVSDGKTEEEAERTEVTVEGVTLKLTAEESEAIHKATLRQAEFSRKMNEVAATEKKLAAVLEHAERMRVGAEKFADVLAGVRMVDHQIKQYEALDWQKLRAEDPAQYAAYAADLQTLKLNKQQQEMQARQVASEVEESSSSALRTKREEMFKALEKALPGWSNQMGSQITEYAIEQGMSFETLAKATDPALVVAIEKARKWDALQKSKTAVQAKAKDAPPALKPGVRVAKQSPTDEAMSQLRKFRTRDAAEVAFLARMK